MTRLVDSGVLNMIEFVWFWHNAAAAAAGATDKEDNVDVYKLAHKVNHYRIVPFQYFSGVFFSLIIMFRT